VSQDLRKALGLSDASQPVAAAAKIAEEAKESKIIA
jgi:hypothetical protein